MRDFPRSLPVLVIFNQNCMHHEQECKMVKLLWKTVLLVSQKVKMLCDSRVYICAHIIFSKRHENMSTINLVLEC
jgi:hypothetical protein